MPIPLVTRILVADDHELTPLRDPARAGPAVTRFRRALVWLVVALLVFMLVATLVVDGAA